MFTKNNKFMFSQYIKRLVAKLLLTKFTKKKVSIISGEHVLPNIPPMSDGLPHSLHQPR